MKYSCYELKSEIYLEKTVALIEITTGIELKKQGERCRYVGRCPVHRDNNPSLHIDIHNGRVRIKCFGCNRPGSVFDILMSIKGISFKHAVDITGDFFHHGVLAPELDSSRAGAEVAQGDKGRG